jgi:hypothetical protein
VPPPVPEPLPESEPWTLVPQAIDDDEEADDLAEAQIAPSPVLPAAAPRSTVTPEVAGILRAEAEREAKARAEEEVARRAVPAAPSAPASLLTRPEPLPAPEPPRQAIRPRELDLDQINSSLRNANDRIGGRAPQVRPARRGGGFAGGFWGALLVLAVLAGLYIAAPTIIEGVPQSRIVLEPYVGAVNEARLWLDRQVGALLGEASAD